MEGVFANRSEKRDFVINELERRATDECPVYIASAFFTHSDVVDRILKKGCKVLMVARLGFPTSPYAIEKVIARRFGWSICLLLCSSTRRKDLGMAKRPMS